MYYMDHEEACKLINFPPTVFLGAFEMSSNFPTFTKRGRFNHFPSSFCSIPIFPIACLKPSGIEVAFPGKLEFPRGQFNMHGHVVENLVNFLFYNYGDIKTSCENARRLVSLSSRIIVRFVH